uniref:Trehalase n=1 Tax=Nippostrongylus brasiliensis TaxID=27835 RepID=A0A0N4XTM1_NIPBR
LQDSTTVYSPLRVNCSEPTCKGELSPIYCFGDIVTTSYLLGLEDSCPGSKMRYSAREVIENFNKFVFPLIGLDIISLFIFTFRLKYPISKADFLKFCQSNFDNVPYLRNVSLPDFKDEPRIFAIIRNKEHLHLAKSVHLLWSKLARQFLEDVHRNTSYYPVVPVQNTFIVPGGRFQIFFYWDSYWILKMFNTARGMIQNFADVINLHGFIPNSGSIQLSRRTQPPLFVQMVKDYFDTTDDVDSLRSWIPAMDKEMQFWISKRRIVIRLPNQRTAAAYIYRTETNCPRPENFLSDYYLGMNSTDPLRTWQGLATACESGWDFSTRWFDHEDSKTTIRTQTIVPVDLNVYMALNFRFLADSHSLLGNKTLSALYHEMYDDLIYTINTLFWNRQRGAWFDFDLLTKKRRADFYPSNVFPLLLNEMERFADDVYSYLEEEGVYDYPGGIPSTLPVKSFEQWDFPNVWAPTQHLFIASLSKTQHAGLQKRALEESYKFIKTVHDGLFNPEQGTPSGIWEKYDARSSRGKPGGGGEYVVQEGFGWTNGVVMALINKVSRAATMDSIGEKGFRAQT